MRVPLQAPAAVDVAVVFSQPEVQGAGESRDERDVGERPAHEVVAALRGASGSGGADWPQRTRRSGYLRRPCLDQAMVKRDPWAHSVADRELQRSVAFRLFRDTR